MPVEKGSSAFRRPGEVFVCLVVFPSTNRNRIQESDLTTQAHTKHAAQSCSTRGWTQPIVLGGEHGGGHISVPGIISIRNSLAWWMLCPVVGSQSAMANNLTPSNSLRIPW